MSTENNLDKTFNSSVKILSDLIAFKSISGEDNNSIINYCEKIFNDLGAESFKIYDSNKKRVNLFATLKSKNKNGKKPIILSGHTDVVPVSKGWSSDPFIATIKNEKLYREFKVEYKKFECDLQELHSNKNTDSLMLKTKTFFKKNKKITTNTTNKIAF